VSCFLSPILRRALLSSCVGSAILSAPAAVAQQVAAPFADAPTQAAAAEAAVNLSEISVSATGLPTPIAATGSSVTVLTDRVLEEQQRRTVPDALQHVPGLNVVQTGGPGGQTSVFIRGANSNQTKVLIDGIDATDPSNANGSFDFGQLLTDDLARIEVLRGPQSGLYGSDAIGGVVSFTTKRGKGPTRVLVRTEGGSFGTFNQFGRISGAQDGFDYSVSIQHFRAAATPVTPRDLVPFDRPIHPNYYDNETVSAKLGYQFTDTFRVNSTTRFINSRLPRFLQAARRIAEVQARHLRGEHVEIVDGDAPDEERGHS
jgi:vitamin B12 transporter